MQKPNLKKSNTCIAIIRDKQGKLVMAGDRRASWGYHFAQSMPKPKISKRSGLLLGATGDGGLCSLFVDIMKIPKRGTSNTDNYISNEFCQAMHNALVAKGYAEEHNLLNIPEDSFCELVVGIESKVYSIIIHNPDQGKQDPKGLIVDDEVNVPYATGCGGISALSVLQYELGRTGYLTHKHLKDAMLTAAQLSIGCDSNIDIIKGD